MSIASQVFAAAVAALHVLIFLMESVLWMRPDVHRRFGVRSVADAEGVRRFAFNQGFYNLFLAIGPAAGVVVYHLGQESAGRALVIYGCAFMVGCGVVLFVSDRRLWRGMIGQSGPPLVALIAALM